MTFEWSTVGTVTINGVRLGYRQCGDHAELAAAQQAPERVAALVLEDLAAPPRVSASVRGVNPLQAHRLAEVTAAIPGSRLTTIPVGHRVHSLGPDAFATEVLGFLALTPAR